MHPEYVSLETPQVCPYLVTVYEQQKAALVLTVPFQSLSFYYQGQWFHLPSASLTLVHQLLGPTFWHPTRLFPTLAFSLPTGWHVWTAQGLAPMGEPAWLTLLQGRADAMVGAWPTDLTFQQALLAWGYGHDIAAQRQGKTIQARLSQHSNDYWLMASLCSFLTDKDVVHGDMHPQDWREARGSLSLILPVYKSAESLGPVFQALSNAIAFLPEQVHTEMLLVDDGNMPPVDLEQMTKQVPVPTQILRLHRHASLATARNIGLAAAKGEVVVFLDSDICVAPNYLLNHWVRHHLFPGCVLVSLREHLPQGTCPPDRMPDGTKDSRWQATYTPDWQGLVTVPHPMTVHPLTETRFFRDFGHAQRVGPTDLPFMVKGHNLSLPRQIAQGVRFPPTFSGWGPEDVCFGAKTIARGAFVIPVLSTGVFHLSHPPRSGSQEQQERELVRNLHRYQIALETFADEDWRTIDAV